MILNQLSQLLAGLALLFTLLAFGWRLRVFNGLARSTDRSTPKGSAQSGILYAFTLGMAPWAKESVRIHWVAYIRGIAFHLGIFLGLAIFLVSPWIPILPELWRNLLTVGAGLGALLGLAGFASRFIEHNLKVLSTPDDYFAVLVVSVFLAVTALWLVVPALLPLYYLVSGFMLVYAPYSKIRHCIYFAYSRMFFGKYLGSRAVLPHSQQKRASMTR